MRRPPGAPLGEVFSFLSGLYFRGKLAYARAFAAPPAGAARRLRHHAERGPARGRTSWWTWRASAAFAQVDIDAGDARYHRPLRRDARRLAAALGPAAEVVLLGSVATGKYVDPLTEVLGERLRFPGRLRRPRRHEPGRPAAALPCARGASSTTCRCAGAVAPRRRGRPAARLERLR